MKDPYVAALSRAELVRRTGRVCQLSGLLIESVGPNAAVGEVCEIFSGTGASSVEAEVVGLRQGRVLLMPYGDVAGVGLDCEVVATSRFQQVRVGDELLGRVVDAFGHPLDSGVTLSAAQHRSLQAEPLNPLSRPPITEVLETGVRAIDTLLTLGRGQRIGIFAGSGVGKSTLLGMIARHMHADVNVIALIGERGREVREFIDKCLGQAGLARSVVVVATSDQPALVRARAAFTATTIAEYFRDAGLDVLLTMDSVTRFAMARREIGLSAGEPPTARGYTPSVFAALPKLLERCGTAATGGSITALYTVLAEGDDFNDPVSDALRSILDGHIMLSRRLANHGHYPAIDPLQSVSRLLGDLADKADRELVRAALGLLSIYEKNHQMIDIGAYRAGSNVELDRAVKLMPDLNGFLRQGTEETASRADAMKSLQAIVSGQGGK